MSLEAPNNNIEQAPPEDREPDNGANKIIEEIRGLYFGGRTDIIAFFLRNATSWLTDKVTEKYYENFAKIKLSKVPLEEIDSMGMQAMALLALRDRFAATPDLHEGCDWSRVEAALIENPAALTSLVNMELAGHEPNVYNFDEKGFDIGTCSPESPLSGRNCVYDEAAVQYLGEHYPSAQFNGNAVEQANAMGISLLTEEQYRKIQSTRQFDTVSWSWLATPQETRNTGYALHGRRYDSGVRVYQLNALDRYGSVAWRGSLRVSWTT